MSSTVHRKPPANARGISQVRFLQMRVAAAEEAVVRAKEATRRAKRQRKLAKLFFKRARKHTKETKAILLKARNALARAELKAMSAKRRLPRPRTMPVPSRNAAILSAA